MPSKVPVSGLTLKTALSSAPITQQASLRPVLPKSKSHQQRIRRMSSNVGTSGEGLAKHDWIVILPDHMGVLEKRMSVRPKHFEGLQPNMEKGFWKVGGATLEEPAKEGEPLKINGSAMIASAATKEEVIETLKQDVYTTNGIWNWDKVQIFPFKAAFYKGNQEKKM